MAAKRSVSVGRRVSRAIFIGLMIGAFGAVGVYYLNTAVNMIAGKGVVDAVGMMLLVFGSSILGSIGIELSGDIAAE